MSKMAPMVITVFPFERSGKTDELSFRNLIACLYYNSLPNGTGVSPRMCIPGTETEIVLPPRVRYEYFGLELPEFKVANAKQGTYVIKFTVPCALMPVGIQNQFRHSAPDVIIFNSDTEFIKESIEMVVRERKKRAALADPEDLRRFIREEEKRGDLLGSAGRIRRFLREGYFLPPDEFLASFSMSGFLWSLPRTVAYAIYQAVLSGKREKILKFA